MFNWFFYLSQFDFFKENKNSESLWRRVFLTPRVLQRKKLEPLFVVLDDIAKIHEKTIAQIALNWLINMDTHIIPISGAKNIRQARENAGTLGWSLTKEEYTRINQTEIITK
jgi:aryl-alcohol dehydrogenase-like predicted oxidoreductase